MSEKSICGSTPWVNRFMPRVTRSTLPVRSPLPNRQPSMRSAPASSPARRPRPPCRGRCAGAARRRRVAPVEVADHPLDRVGVDVRGDHLDRRRQVDDHLVVGRRVDDLDDLVADPHGEVELGAGVGLRGVLVEDVGLRDGLLELAAQPRALDGDVDDALLGPGRRRRGAAGSRSSCRSGRWPLGAADRVEGALDEVVAALGEHLDGHVVGDVAAVDELAAEVEVGLLALGKPTSISL
jgi:hypothetical protein